MTRRLFKSPLFMFYFLALLITYSYQVMKNVCIICLPRTCDAVADALSLL